MRGAAPPVSEGRAPAEEDGFSFGLRLIKESKEGVILHTDLPEVLAFISTAQQELQRILVRSLETKHEVSKVTNSRTFRKHSDNRLFIPMLKIRKIFFSENYL